MTFVIPARSRLSPGGIFLVRHCESAAADAAIHAMNEEMRNAWIATVFFESLAMTKAEDAGS